MPDKRLTISDLDEREVLDGSEEMEIGTSQRGWRTSLEKLKDWILGFLAPVAESGVYADLTGKPNLGTAAAADTTTSATDTTAGRLMRVGDGGLLSTVVNNTSPDEGYTYFFSTSTSDSRFGASFITGVNIARDTDRSFMIGGRTLLNDVRVVAAATTAGGALPSVELYHTGNLGASDTAWTTVTSLLNGWTGTVRYIKRGGMVTVQLDGLDGSSKTSNTFLNLPAGYRPPYVFYVTPTTANTDYIRIFGPGSAVTSDLSTSGINAMATYPVLP